MTIRAIVFDYFGTLTPTVTAMASEQERAAIERLLGVDRDELERAWGEVYDERATGRMGGIRAALGVLADRLGAQPEPSALDEAAEIRMTAYRRTARPRDGAVDVLAALRRAGFPIGLVSDCSTDLVELWPSLPFAPLVDAPVFSAAVGRRKPDPLLFQTVCERLGVLAGDCLYVGDGGSGELTGATSFGMRAVLLADAEWTRGHRYQADTDWRGERISALEQVLELVTEAG